MIGERIEEALGVPATDPTQLGGGGGAEPDNDPLAGKEVIGAGASGRSVGFSPSASSMAWLGTTSMFSDSAGQWCRGG